MKKIGVLDFRIGNISSLLNMINKLGFDAVRINMSSEINLTNIYNLILPGVGSFDNAMEKLSMCKSLKVLEKEIFENKKIILGICVGMQILFQNSEEGNSNGLGWIEGTVKKINCKLPIPHMGWNQLKILNQDKIFENLKDNSRFYFCHSYEVKTSIDNILATTDYDNLINSIVKKENIYGFQFHPEKSHKNGFDLIRNFCNLNA